MKIIVIGSDRKLFETGSNIQGRFLAFGRVFGEIHVIVFSAKKLGYSKTKIGSNIFVYPTNHRLKLLYFFKVYSLAKLLLSVDNYKINELRRTFVLSTQDPFEAGLAGWLLKIIFKIPLQLQIHTDFLSPYFVGESWLNRFRVCLAKFLLPRADKIRVVSQRIADSITTARIKLKEPPIVLPVFVDLDKLRQAPVKTDLHQKYPQFKKIILIASRLTREKQINLAIDALPEIARQLPSTGLVIVGSGPEEAKLKKLVEAKNLTSQIIFEPWTNDLPSYYRTADLFLNTSAYEGYGLTIVEALAVGTPVVSTDVGVAPIMLASGGNGLIIAIGDRPALISGICSLLGDGLKRESHISESQKLALGITTEEQYLKSYKQSYETS